jgi:hypothetical protein
VDAFVRQRSECASCGRVEVVTAPHQGGHAVGPDLVAASPALRPPVPGRATAGRAILSAAEGPGSAVFGWPVLRLVLRCRPARPVAAVKVSRTGRCRQ